MSRGLIPSMLPQTMDWESRLSHIVQTMREMSSHTDPEEMVRAYATRMRGLMRFDRTVALSRRALDHPKVRITRSTTWETPINPWKNQSKLPVLDGGLFAELIYGNEPRLIDDLTIDPRDPAREYLEGMRSLIAVPNFDGGEGLNMVVHMRRDPGGFDREQLPEYVWMSNLFGRATHNLVLSSQLKEAYKQLDAELAVVSDIQRSLLPVELPEIPGMDLAAFYQTSRHAGGDYYDLFPLAGNQWGILIADVSGHGTPAAVVMAIMHSIAHAYQGPPASPAHMLRFLNERLSTRYMGSTGTFVTAFYGIYDPATRRMTYSSAGHNPPRLKRHNQVIASLDRARRLPLGILVQEQYEEMTMLLEPGDEILFYTDGITEARAVSGEMFGEERMDDAFAAASGSSQQVLDAVLESVRSFTLGRPADDDRTLLAARFR